MDEEKAKVLIQKIQASILMLQQIEADLKEATGITLATEPPMKVEELWLGDDGKEYQKSTPYIKAKQWYCCGVPLQQIEKDGRKVFHCEKCNSTYSA